MLAVNPAVIFQRCTGIDITNLLYGEGL